MASEIVGEKRGGSGSIKRGEGNSLTFTSSVTFLVVTDSKSVTREEVLLQTPGLPIVGLLYGPYQLVCTSKSCTRSEINPLYWDVVCEFESNKEDQKQDQNNPSENPTTWIPVFKVDSFTTKEKIIIKDRTTPTAKTISNSAETPFETPLTETKTLAQFSFVQFENPAQDLKTLMDRNDSVNKTTFAGRAARTLLLELSGAELGYFGGFNAWRVAYKCTYDPDTFDVKMLDVGPVTLAGQRCVDVNGIPIIGNLDGSGNQVSAGTAPYEITFRIKKEIEFADFIRS
tara:strand:- start:3018 stop:3875 length:858 start_codon:yes stop_codon:yes gene_type:complete